MYDLSNGLNTIRLVGGRVRERERERESESAAEHQMSPKRVLFGFCFFSHSGSGTCALEAVRAILLSE